VLTDGCQVRIFSQIEVIKTYYCELLRYLDFQLAGSFQNAKGLEVRCGKNGGRRLGQAE
jgi:hypothetical protein